MQVSAKLRHLRISPRKIRLVADVIRGLDVSDAQNQLSFMNKRAAEPMLKLLNSSIANAQNNLNLKKDNLYISELRVDQGPTLKRWMPRAMGRASAINKRTSHILIVLDEKTDKEIKNKKLEIIKKETEKKKKDDVKIVKSLDEVKKLSKKEDIKIEIEKPVSKEYKPEPFDVRRKASDRNKQHLDIVRKKGKGGVWKRMFRRKSV